MKINWDALRFKGYKLDYYAVTIKNGRKDREKVYYMNYTDNIMSVGNIGLDFLLSLNHIKCFSFGMDGNNCQKFDFTICTKESNIIYETLAKAYSYFDFDKLNILLDCFGKHNLKYANHVIGTKKYINNNGVVFGNICLYFRMDARINFFRAKDFINDITNCYLLRGETVLYPTEKNSWLHMIGLDFSENEFKLKFYFEFTRKHDPMDIAKCFENSENYNLALDLVNSNGYLEMLQVAISSKNEVSYNFYFKEDCLIGQ